MKAVRYTEIKIWWHDAGHMTKMAATPIYGKNPSKIFFSGTGGPIHETWYVVLGTPAHHILFKWWPSSDLDLFYGKVKFGNLGFSIGKSENGGFSETIAASDLKQKDFVKICEYWRSMSFLDLGQRSCTYKDSNRIFSDITVLIWTKLCMKAFKYKEMKIWWHDAGHMTKMAAMPIYRKNPLKIFLSRTGRQISTELGM